MSAGQVLARLAAAAQKLDEAKAKTVAAVQDVEEARNLTAGALEGIGGAQLIGIIDACRQALGQAAQAADPAKQHVQETMTRVQALGS
ncbi:MULTISPECIES: DUF6244 family protein [Micromonospora]|uniref:Uncharacterized protein n=1 Tax=Micromonospora yangpuensis TaxID=683228 RepID=A0A1C6V992_9ACTN|nr:DUF6244 family protein [Micromonospora yangpuensis]GGM21864.1 hypothetical protein GCM10012279_45250 [Micromonospora yangpuensis]SCL62846.1 hypothetical protein GA0070617_5037 [Micromonospora yangpuensis]